MLEWDYINGFRNGIGTLDLEPGIGTQIQYKTRLGGTGGEKNPIPDPDSELRIID